MKAILLILLVLNILIHPVRSEYTLTILESEAESTAFGLNKYGWSCGYASDPNGLQTPCVWSPEGKLIMLPPLLPGDTRKGIAYAVNDYFEVGGHYGTMWSTGNFVHKISYGTSTVWTLDENGWYDPFEIIETPSSLRDINNNGDIVGNSGDYAYIFNVYDGSGFDDPKYDTEYFAINEAGNATGHDGGRMTFAEWQPDGSYTTTTSGVIGTNSIQGFTAGLAINKHNDIVGTSLYLGGFVWNPKSGTETLLETGSWAWGINDSGTVVGELNGNACFWRKSGAVYVRSNLDTFTDEYVLEIALGINNRGHIVGRCRHAATGVKKAFLLTPVHDMRLSLQLVGSNVQLQWHTQDGMDYVVETSTNLTEWTELPTRYVGDGGVLTVNLPKVGPKKFFRVREITF